MGWNNIPKTKSWYCPKCGYEHETNYCPRGVIAPVEAKIRICPYCNQEIKEQKQWPGIGLC